MIEIREKWYKIGEVSKMLDISVELIRAYENGGLVLTKRTDSGQRLFNENDVKWIRCIRRQIKEQGMNMEGIRRMLSFIPCWKCGHCTEAERDKCPAYLTSDKPCWMIKAESQGPCKNAECRDCKVYQRASCCENLKENLMTFNAEAI